MFHIFQIRFNAVKDGLYTEGSASENVYSCTSACIGTSSGTPLCLETKILLKKSQPLQSEFLNQAQTIPVPQSKFKANQSRGS